MFLSIASARTLNTCEVLKRDGNEISLGLMVHNETNKQNKRIRNEDVPAWCNVHCIKHVHRYM